ncbi:hypothetical protein NFI96_004748 [Prochilodus magdalenae]|nr:hypothetical protein NFI96_004748 [Prochilodus magdalenae]
MDDVTPSGVEGAGLDHVTPSQFGAGLDHVTPSQFGAGLDHVTPSQFGAGLDHVTPSQFGAGLDHVTPSQFEAGLDHVTPSQFGAGLDHVTPSQFGAGLDHVTPSQFGAGLDHVTPSQFGAGLDHVTPSQFGAGLDHVTPSQFGAGLDHVTPSEYGAGLDHVTPSQFGAGLDHVTPSEYGAGLDHVTPSQFGAGLDHVTVFPLEVTVSSLFQRAGRSHPSPLSLWAGAEFVHHNARQLTRVYPNGIRTESSNFNPQEMWNAGCQIVALNFQTAGTEMDLNDGLFSQNGRCGYVLKPAFMRSMEKQFDPDHPEMRDGYRPVTLSVEVISGQQLPKVNQKEESIVDPLVRVEIHGVLKDQAKQETRYIDNNGFNPTWQETLKFIIHVPELALVRFVVEDHDKTSKNDFIGQYTLPFSCIQQGYRHIHLLSKDGTSIPPSSLFVHIGIKEGS